MVKRAVTAIVSLAALTIIALSLLLAQPVTARGNSHAKMVKSSSHVKIARGSGRIKIARGYGSDITSSNHIFIARGSGW